jgi:membrane dipeptidase
MSSPPASNRSSSVTPAPVPVGHFTPEAGRRDTGRCRKRWVIGIEAAPYTTLTMENREHSLETVMQHVEYCVALVGVDHVALGPDTFFGDHIALHKVFAAHLSSGQLRTGPSFTEVEYVAGIENPSEGMANAVKWLVKHGYTDGDIDRLVGGNVLRVIRAAFAR